VKPWILATQAARKPKAMFFCDFNHIQRILEGSGMTHFPAL